MFRCALLLCIQETKAAIHQQILYYVAGIERRKTMKESEEIRLDNRRVPIFLPHSPPFSGKIIILNPVITTNNDGLV